ncbi:MAG: hypothetical protein AB8B50_20720 [Pirellulaceae bacterium]
MSLKSECLDFDHDATLPDSVARWTEQATVFIRRFWDSRSDRQHVHYVESDFEFLARAMRAVLNQDRVSTGKLFMEWGCSFAVNAGNAAHLGWEAWGIESVEFLVAAAKKLHSEHASPVQVVHGNFLPPGAESFALEEDPVVARACELPSAYESANLTLRDFDLILAYPWPGEEHFLKAVFDGCANVGSHLLLYRGPFHVELFRKTR